MPGSLRPYVVPTQLSTGFGFVAIYGSLRHVASIGFVKDFLASFSISFYLLSFSMLQNVKLFSMAVKHQTGQVS